MIWTKPVLALSSLGLGAALVLVALHVERDRFAFTVRLPRDSDVFTLVAPITEPPALFEEVASERASQAAPLTTPRVQSKKPAAPARPNEAARPPCNPAWRQLESGPAGKSVRELC